MELPGNGGGGGGESSGVISRRALHILNLDRVLYKLQVVVQEDSIIILTAGNIHCDFQQITRATVYA